MKLLAIETATEVCGIAYFENGAIQGLEEAVIYREHAKSLPMFYKKLQDKTHFKLEDLDGIAVSIGPGSFTGLRIGLSFAKGLAYSHDLPIIPVPTLQGISMAGSSANLFHVLLFSHRDMIYHQSFAGKGSPVSDPAVNSWADLTIKIENSTCFHVNCDKFIENHEKTEEVQGSAKYIGVLAGKHFDEWVEHNPFTLVPNYIAPFEMNKPA